MTSKTPGELVGIVVVSHSAELASGVVDLARQMAPDVPLLAAGGGDDGGIGTSFDLIEQRVSGLLDGDDDSDGDSAGVVLLYDLGSAQLTAEMVLEMLDPEQQERCRLVDAPLVEGAIAAAVAAQGGADLSTVAAAARDAGGPTGDTAPGDPADVAADITAPNPASAERRADDWVCADVTLTNPLGLHARPAARLARELGQAEATVALPGGAPVDLRSVMTVVGLGARGGNVVRVCVRGDDAQSTLDTLVGLIDEGFGERSTDGSPAETTPAPGAGEADEPDRAQGPAPGSDGLAVGELVEISAVPRELPTDLPDTARSTDVATLRAAVDAAADRLDQGDEFARTHAAVLRDPSLLRAATEQVDRGAGADSGVAQAWWDAVTAAADEAAASPDPVLAARAVDVLEAGAAVLRDMGIDTSPQWDRATGRIVLADDLGPAAVTALAEHGAAGVALRRGQSTAHAVVVASGFGLPMVIRVGAALDDAIGREVVLDGTNGTVEVEPSADRISAVRADIDAADREREQARVRAQSPVSWRGRPVLVAANIGSASGAEAAVLDGADAVGLLRTELLVLEEPQIPSEDEQVDALRAVLAPLGDRPVVVRVLDPGGDKPVQALELNERDNGFLGVRGLRYLLRHPELLQTQLRAVLRASVGHRVSVMAPMVTTAAEAQAFRAAVGEAQAALRADDIEHAPPRGIGVMVEVPAAALSVAQLAPYVDFLSVGTNDLMSYLSAADRTSAEVADLLDMSSVALWRLLRILCDDAREHGLPVAVCGELAGRPEHTRALLDLGVHELSMAPARIPQVKAVIRESSTDG